MWQALYVKEQLQIAPSLVVELVPIVTKGDIILDDTPISKSGW